MSKIAVLQAFQNCWSTRLMPVLLLGTLFALGLSCGDPDLVGTPPPDARIDTFDQRAAGKIDVLWVIDNSPSMAAHRKNVAENFHQFFAALVRSKSDFHVGVTTTDLLSDNGELVGNPAVITPKTPDPVAVFASNIQVGEAGVAWEQGFEAARRTLDLHRSAFIRDDAHLFLVFVSDEDDQSRLGSPYHFYRFFKSSKGKGNEQMVAAGAIVGDMPDGCIPARCGSDGCFGEGSGAGNAEAGERYHEFIALMEGQVGSICDEEFASILFEMGMDAVGLQRKFELSAEPDDVDELEVEVHHPCDTSQESLEAACSKVKDRCENQDGYFLCETRPLEEGGQDGFSWEHATRSVLLHGRAIPPRGAKITIRYMEKKR